MMEPMSGREFLRELRRPERKVDVPVIMLSASSEPNDIAFAQQFRISGWLTKPIALPELLRQISTVLTLSANCAPLDTGFELDAGRLAERYRSKITDDLRILDEALLAMQNIKEIDSSSWAAAAQRGTTWALVDRVMHNIKGQAGSFNLDLITFIAALGQELTRPMANSNFLVRNHHDAVHPAVVALVEAMRIVLQNGIRGDGGQIGERLLEKLRGHTRPIRAGLESDAEGRAGPPRTSRPPVSS
jgi:CheY-like chemotaxis protein